MSDTDGIANQKECAPQLWTPVRTKLEEALDGLNKDYPAAPLLRVPMSEDSTAEIKVSRWPQSVKEIDVLISGLRAIRTAFLKATPHKKRP